MVFLPQGVLCKFDEDEPPMITLTLDDGAADQYTNLYPVFKKYGITGTLFVVTNWVGSSGHMNWEQIEDFYSIGWEIGSHTKSHPNLTTLTDEQLLDEVAGSKDIIAENIGVEPTSLAYPGGYRDNRVKSVVAEYYDRARATFFPPVLTCFPFHMPAGYLTDPYDLMGAHTGVFEQWLRTIKLLSTFGGWYIDVKHDSGEFGGTAVLEKIIKRAISYGVEFVTLEEGARRLFKPRKSNRIHDLIASISASNGVLDNLAGWWSPTVTVNYDQYPYVSPPAGELVAVLYGAQIPVHGGQRVFASARIKADENIVLSKLLIRYFSDNLYLEDHASSDFGGNYDWTRVSFSSVAPSDSTHATVLFHVKSSTIAPGRFYWDRVCLFTRTYPQVDSDYVLRVRTIS